MKVEEKEEDRISKLPNSLIHEIFSFIDTRYAVQSSVLSKRWKNVWMSLPFIKSNWSTFKIRGDDLTKGDISKKMRGTMIRLQIFLEKVLQLRDGSDIYRIKLGLLTLDENELEAINRCILKALNHNVQELDIRGYYVMSYQIPHQLLNCKSLKTLSIALARDLYFVWTDTVLPESMSLPQLRKVCLGGFSISILDLQRLFSSCPLIETISLQRCNIQMNNQGGNVLIDSHSLQSLRLLDNQYTGLENKYLPCTTEISAPNVKDFTCTGLMNDEYSLENLSSVVSAHLRIRVRQKEVDETAHTYSELPTEEKQVFAKRMTKFLGAVQKVQHLELSSGFLEVLLQAPGTLSGQHHQLCNLETLELEMRFTRGSLDSVAYLLQVSPIIKTLVLTSKESNLPDVGDDWEVGFSSTCMFSHLKSVEIREVEGCDNELMFLRCLLKRSMVLQKLTLVFKSATASDSLDRGLFRRKVTALPKASSNIRMSFYNFSRCHSEAYQDETLKLFERKD